MYAKFGQFSLLVTVVSERTLLVTVVSERTLLVTVASERSIGMHFTNILLLVTVMHKNNAGS